MRIPPNPMLKKPDLDLSRTTAHAVSQTFPCNMLLPHSKVKLRDSWLFLSDHFVSHQLEPWKPGNSFIIKYMTYTLSYCLFLSNNLKTVRRAHPVNGFHMKHPPAVQGAYSICEQKSSYKSPERKVWEVNIIFCQTLFPF